ncbi:subtilisin-like protease SBT1.8 [Ricinus communis]|nr:subtilisin-like protease SBT1.8 [Ricinus communis]
MGSMATTFYFFSLVLSFSLPAIAKKTYIVHVNHNAKPNSYPTHHHWYQSLVTSSSSDSLLYTYTAAFHGFAAHLDPQEADALREMDSVLNVFEEEIYTLQTTHTPQFLGIDANFGLSDGRNFNDVEQASADVIVGVLDSGVWPESKSFDDKGLPAIPKRWKGKCKSTKDFDHKLCNKKLIGARYFVKGHKRATQSKEIVSSRDYDGHGTHTASTVAGSPVANASMFRYARGTARGMAVRARVASYKVCWSTGCLQSDIVAGIDRAILDGVDLLSLSLESRASQPLPYYADPIAIGAFSAMEAGILVSCSAGNRGPEKSSVSNVAPWIMTVAAGSIDRDFPAYALLGNKQRVAGVSISRGRRRGMGKRKPVNLVYHKGSNSSSNFCLRGTLEPTLVRGQVVICDQGKISPIEKGLVVHKAGGVGMILVDNTVVKELVAHNHLLPTVAVGKKGGKLIKKYVKTDPNPTVLLSFGGTVVGVRPSPMVAAFSSRGPNPVTPQILKPDIMAPGVNILAAFSEGASPTGLKEDKRITKFLIASGTSMSCPHVSGIAALVKAAHPTWSPSALRSALMTTAYTVDSTNTPLQDAVTAKFSNPWAYGSGHVDPKRALSPGLVYDISPQDYVTFLCSLNYDLNLTCPRKFSDLGELNYPSFSVLFGKKTTAVRYSRELTNVGTARATYRVAVTAPSEVAVTVAPAKLVFKKVGEKLRYTATFAAKRNAKKPAGGAAFGSIVWSNAKYKVSSPVAFAWT